MILPDRSMEKSAMPAPERESSAPEAETAQPRSHMYLLLSALFIREVTPDLLKALEEPDLKNIWWKAEGVNPNYVIPVSADPIGGSQGWYDTVASVTPAKPGDKFGDVRFDNAKHYEFFKETLRYAYTGDKHREMHPEVKVEKLPPAELKTGH